MTLAAGTCRSDRPASRTLSAIDGCFGRRTANWAQGRHLIREGYHPELDLLRRAASDGKTGSWNWRRPRRERTGIKSSRSATIVCLATILRSPEPIYPWFPKTMSGKPWPTVNAISLKPSGNGRYDLGCRTKAGDGI